MSQFSEMKRTTWSVLPAALVEAGQLAFPNCKSPRTIPDDKWTKLVVAYKTWYHVLYSGDLLYNAPLESSTKAQRYLNEIASKIAEN